MGFSDVCTALYAYQPQNEEELALEEGDLLYILDKGGEDGWWKAKKRVTGEDDADQEPEGLIPENYVEKVRSERVMRSAP